MNVVNSIAQGDKIEKVVVEDDTTELLEKVKDAVESWNNVLEG